MRGDLRKFREERKSPCWGPYREAGARCVFTGARRGTCLEAPALRRGTGELDWMGWEIFLEGSQRVKLYQLKLLEQGQKESCRTGTRCVCTVCVRFCVPRGEAQFRGPKSGLSKRCFNGGQKGPQKVF